MISTLWLKKRRSHWTELAELQQRVEKGGLKSLGHSELQRFALLYRQAAADLSTLRQDPSGASYGKFLGELLSRAHNSIYAAQPANKKAVFDFYLKTYPAIFQRNLRYTAVATVIFTLAAVAGSILTFRDPDFSLQILGPGMLQTIERREMWTHSIVAMKPVASSAIMTNNLAVAFTMFSAGILAGIGTVVMTLFNGLLLGVIGSACWISGMSIKLWSFVAPHGVLELPAIFIAAGAGLRLAQGLLFPGTLPRRDALINAGSEAVQLLLGVIPMLIVAGVIEGFVSPSALPIPLKFGLAAALFAFLLAYLFSAPNSTQPQIRFRLLSSR
jgi:uncharacterized membrane protein SpoIIM required for sporulation